MRGVTELVYAQVRLRDQMRCARCGGAGSNWHHRRGKSVRDEHTHCTCNGVWLCGSGTTGCHWWVHNHPLIARQEGWIVSRHEREPFNVPMMYVMTGCKVLLDCDGGLVPRDSREVR